MAPEYHPTIAIPITDNSNDSIPMRFVGTSVNMSSNTLTGNAEFACTAQNLGIVTGTTTYVQCIAPGSPSVANTVTTTTNTTPTFTGSCQNNTLITLYTGTTALSASALCNNGTYSATASF